MADQPPIGRRLLDLARGGFLVNQGRVVAYTDGSVLGNGRPHLESRGGIGIYWVNGAWASKLSGSKRLPGKQTVIRAELYATIRAIEQHPDPNVGLEVRTDSIHVVMCRKLYPVWRARQWTRWNEKKIPDLDLVKRLARVTDSLNCKVVFVHVRGHAGIGGNEIAHVGARMPPVRVFCVDCGRISGEDGCHCNGDEDEDDNDSGEEESDYDDYFEITKIVPAKHLVLCVECGHDVGPNGCHCEAEERKAGERAAEEGEIPDGEIEEAMVNEGNSKSNNAMHGDKGDGSDNAAIDNEMDAIPRGVKRGREESFDRAVRRRTG